MASDKMFEAIPANPDDIPTAPVHTVLLASLISGDAPAARSVLDACQELGFFLLDLRGDALGNTVINGIDSLFAAGQDIMNLHTEVKEKYPHDLPKSLLGRLPSSPGSSCPQFT
jgi:hypothetical protein